MALPDAAAPDSAGQELAARAIRLLAVREHSVQELRRKLRRTRTPDSADDAAIEAVLEDLQRDGLLSEERFVEAFVRSRLGRGQGPAKIRAGLMERGVARKLVDDALDQLDQDRDFWRDRARTAQARRFGAAPSADRADWAKRARFLSARGFGPDVIYRTLGEQPV
ncbi:MAG: regulatory protein RecX [Gammaproteobacteria bacterium]|nr:regulatory protein RecX [Gammaproteobacteria bacterium]